MTTMMMMIRFKGPEIFFFFVYRYFFSLFIYWLSTSNMMGGWVCVCACVQINSKFPGNIFIHGHFFFVFVLEPLYLLNIVVIVVVVNRSIQSIISHIWWWWWWCVCVCVVFNFLIIKFNVNTEYNLFWFRIRHRTETHH